MSLAFSIAGLTSAKPDIMSPTNDSTPAGLHPVGQPCVEPVGIPLNEHDFDRSRCGSKVSVEIEHEIETRQIPNDRLSRISLRTMTRQEFNCTVWLLVHRG
jgi:hypothetical protein